MALLRENLFEAKLNLPQEYIDKVRREASETIGLGGPSREDIREMQQLLQQIFSIQRGHKDALTEVGKEVIQKFYGPIIKGVELDIKIVDPNDQEKLEMAQKMLQDQQEEEQEQEEEGDMPPPVEVELELPGLEEDIDKRKLINTIMQGEAQNVHDMMYDVRTQVEEITGNNELLDLYMRFLALNRKFDWDESVNLEQMMTQAPQMANAMETEWEEGEGEDKPKIKARVLDLPMLVHETVKGIYELIASGAIDPDPVRAQRILKATDTLADEQEDIRYGPFIAKDVRNYVNKVADKITGAYDIPNMREYVFGKMIEMPSTDFVQLVTAMIMDQESAESTISKFIKEIQEEFKEYQTAQIEDEPEELPLGVEEEPTEEEPEDKTLVDLIKKKEEPKEVPKGKKLVDMGKNELNVELNKALDNKDWERAKEIQQMIDRKGGV